MTYIKHNRNYSSQNIFLYRNFYNCCCRIHHYSIERQADGTVMIQDGRRFCGPIELINHHKHNLDGFLTKPRIPCIRPEGVVPMAWPGISMLELEQLVIEKALSMGLQVSDSVCCRNVGMNSVH